MPAAGIGLIVDLDVGVDEQAVARHLDIVEDQERVLFVKTRRQRMVEHVGGSGDTVAADEFQARCSHRNAERDGKFVAIFRQRASRIGLQQVVTTTLTELLTLDDMTRAF